MPHPNLKLQSVPRLRLLARRALARSLERGPDAFNWRALGCAARGEIRARSDYFAQRYPLVSALFNPSF